MKLLDGAKMVDESRICLIGYPRSGTHLVERVLAPYFGLYLDEALRPRGSSVLREYPDGRGLYSSKEPDAEPQTRAYRLRLLVKHSASPHFTKFFVDDLIAPGVLEWLRSVKYRFIAIERLDLLDNILSGVIAREHMKWHMEPGEEYPEFHPFTVDPGPVKAISRRLIAYQELKAQIRDMIFTTVTYERHILPAKTRTDIIQAAHLPTLFNCVIMDNRPLPVQKLQSKRAKMELIHNLDEVICWCQEEGLNIDTSPTPSLNDPW